MNKKKRSTTKPRRQANASQPGVARSPFSGIAGDIVSTLGRTKALIASIGALVSFCLAITIMIFASVNRPNLSFKVMGDGEPEPILVGWGEQLLLLNIENDSPTPIELDYFGINFEASSNFQLLQSTSFHVTLNSSGRIPNYSVEFSSLPTLYNEDLHSGITYLANRSTSPFEMTFIVKARIADSYIRSRLHPIPTDWIPKIPFPISRTFTRTVRYSPNGRETMITVPNRPNKNFQIYGPALMTNNSFYTSDLKDTTQITCFGQGADGRIKVAEVRPAFFGMCK